MKTSPLLHVLHVDLLVFKNKVHTWSKCSSGARESDVFRMNPPLLHVLHVDLSVLVFSRDHFVNVAVPVAVAVLVNVIV